MKQLQVADGLSLALITTPEEGVHFVKDHQSAVNAARAVGADRKTVNKYAEKMVRGIRRTGELIEQLPRSKGGRGKTLNTDVKRFVTEAAITHQTALRWQAIAGIPADEFDAAIARVRDADDPKAIITVVPFYRMAKQLRRDAEHAGNEQLVAQAPTFDSIEGAFSTLVVDPPWDWGDEGDVSQLGRARPRYATLPIEQLSAWPMASKAAPDSHLYLWITNRSLPKGFPLLQAWGYRYITLLTWCKPSFGMGNYFRGQTEHVLFGVKGSLPLMRKDVGTWFAAPRGNRAHSAKPDAFFDLVESCSPGPYLSVWDRARERTGWKFWGAEANAA
jgi:N6-adenosine-specific RNA methylase IME4